MCEFLLPLIKVQVYLFAFVKGTTHCFNSVKSIVKFSLDYYDQKRGSVEQENCYVFFW